MTKHLSIPPNYIYTGKGSSRAVATLLVLHAPSTSWAWRCYVYCVRGRHGCGTWAGPTALITPLFKMSDMDDDVYDEEEDYDLVSELPSHRLVMLAGRHRRVQRRPT